MQQNQSDVVYNLFEYANGLYLPNAYVVSVDKMGKYAHIRQKALVHTIGGFGLELDEVRKRIFEVVDLLQPEALEKRYNTNKRKAKPLDVLLAEREVKKTVLKFVNRYLDEMLQLIARNKLPLSLDAARKVMVLNFVVETGDFELNPLLFFNRTEKHVAYRLVMQENGEKWHIHHKDVVPVCNHPAWVVVDYKLYKIAHINGNMVKPFQKKNEVIIPPASVNAYFKTFILKIAEKVDIDAYGFQIVTNGKLLACRIEAVRNLFNDQWGISLQMVYPGVVFNWSDKKEKRTTIEFENDDIRIVRVSRNFKNEATFVEKIKSFGLENKKGSYFHKQIEASLTVDKTENAFIEESVLPERTDSTSMLEWLSENKSVLEKAGFEVSIPHYEGANIYLQTPKLDLDVNKQNDWFDVHAIVTIGEFSFPFAKLGQNIREGNAYYRLPNGEIFVIPEEWMSKYSDFFKFVKHKGDKLQLVKSQFTLLNKMGLEVDGIKIDDSQMADFQLSKLLKAKLRPYQMDGVKWLVQLYQSGLGACLADDMGLGKTVQTIAVLLHAKEQKTPATGTENQAFGQMDLFAAADTSFLKPLNALIVLPASLVFNWQSELLKFAPSLTVYRHVGPKRHKDIRLLHRFDVILTTYQTALRDIDLLQKLEYEYIVLDESQQIKNRESKVFKALNELEAKHKISLSGTPIENSLSDLWSQMQFINPELLGSFPFFKKEFLRPIEKLGLEDKKDRLRTLVEPYLLRRTKEEVAKDLPELTTKILYAEMATEQRKIYEKEKSAARNYLLENFNSKDGKYKLLVLQTLTKLRQLANHPVLVKPDFNKESGKFRDVLEQYDIIQKSGHKVLIFSSFVKYLNLFKAEFESKNESYSLLTGSLTAKQRQVQIDRFEKEESIKSFLISIKAGGIGLNLTAADYVFILDPWWNPTTEQQAIARAHRIGQTKSVIAIKFITRDSIEEKILKLQERKSKLAADIIGGTEKMSLTKGDVAFLLE